VSAKPINHPPFLSVSYCSLDKTSVGRLPQLLVRVFGSRTYSQSRMAPSRGHRWSQLTATMWACWVMVYCGRMSTGINRYCQIARCTKVLTCLCRTSLIHGVVLLVHHYAVLISQSQHGRKQDNDR